MQHLSGQRSQTLASPSTVRWVRWSSAVDSAVEMMCTGLTHKARAALSGLRVGVGMSAGAAFAHPRAADGDALRSGRGPAGKIEI